MGLLVALGFLTALPLPAREVKPTALGRASAYFPLVGLLLGLALVALDALLGLIWPGAIADAGLVLALVLLTGGFHLDGLMDSCDGLFGRRDPARRLEIMRDSRVGSFGVLGAVCTLLLLYAALGELTRPWRWGALLVAPTLGRWAMVLAIWRFPYARPEGLGRAFKDGVGPWQVAVASLIAVAVACGALGLGGVAAFVVAGAAALLIGAFVCTRIPGLTGDSYGAINEVVQIVSLLTILAWARAGYG